MKFMTVLMCVFVLLVAASDVRGDAIWNIRFAPEPVAAMQFNQNVDITFDYITAVPGGVRIFARPMAGSALAPNYAAHPSPVYGQGTGSGTGYFTIMSGDVTIDAVRFQVTNADQSVLILEFFVPVRFYYGSQAIYNIVATPSSPANMQFNTDVTLTFDYRTNESGGVRMFARPMSGTSTTANYAAHASPVYPAGTGSGTGSFTITSGDATVDGIRFQMMNANQTALLLEFVVPVDYLYRAHSVADIAFTPVPPEGLVWNNDVTMTFSYRTTESGGVRIFPRPFTDGNLSPSYAASASPVYPVGSGAGNASFTITSGDVTVDSVRFLMTSADQSRVLLEYFVPVNFHFAGHRVSAVRFNPSSPAHFTLGQPDTVTFDYATTEAGGVRIFARPMTAGALSPSYSAHPSPLYPMGSAFGSGWFQIDAGSVLVDAVRMRMTNDNQSAQLLEWVLPVQFQYGNMTATAVSMSETPASFELLQNYPNPFNPVTTIRYSVGGIANGSGGSSQGSGWVTLTIYDLLGREVAVLVNEQKAPGTYEVKFDAAGLSSGIYMYHMHSGDFVQVRKLLVLK